MQIKMALRFHLTLVKMVIIRKTSKCLWGCGKEVPYSPTVGDSRTSAATKKTSTEISLNIESSYHLAQLHHCLACTQRAS